MKRELIKFIILLLFLIGGCTLDLITKEMANDSLTDRSVTVINHYFDLTYVQNHAIAFGFLGNISQNIRIPLIFVLTISATMFGFYMIWKLRNKKFRFLLPFFILIGGAYGNIIDRMLHGYVTDFFHLHYFDAYHFYVFNVADVLVNIGIILIILQWKSFQKIVDEIFPDKKEVEVA